MLGGRLEGTCDYAALALAPFASTLLHARELHFLIVSGASAYAYAFSGKPW